MEQFDRAHAWPWGECMFLQNTIMDCFSRLAGLLQCHSMRAKRQDATRRLFVARCRLRLQRGRRYEDKAPSYWDGTELPSYQQCSQKMR